MATIHVAQGDGVATVTLSNPGKQNALSLAMWERLAQVFSDLSDDTALRCVIVRGEGGHFAAGADISEFSVLRANVEQGLHYHNEIIAGALRAIAEGLHPTVAAIEGSCVGGGLEIACACDLRIAAPNARFGIPINRLGFPLAPGELPYLLNLAGPATAMEILLEGRVFDATEARSKGLLHRIADDVGAEAERTAQRIASGAPLAARMNRQLIRRLTATPAPLDAQEMLSAFATLSSSDYQEGVQAFLAKREPHFTGT